MPSGQTYTQQLTASGGTAPYRFHLYTGTAVANNRPAWASISSSGLLTLNPPRGDESSYTMYVYAFDKIGQHSPTARDAITFTTGAPVGPPDPTPPPVRYTSISAGDDHTCGSTTTGEVHCWGRGANGRLGNGSTTDSTAPVTVTGVIDAIQVSAGGYSSCALRATGAVVCWGSNVSGQLGNGTTTDSSTPVPVTGLSDAIAIDVGYVHACALRASGSVVCWGGDQWGQLGNDTTADTFTTPVAVSGLSNATSVEAGLFSSCATRDVGPPVCWGNNGSARLGTGNQTDSHVPVEVQGIDSASAVDSDGINGGYGCAVRLDAGVSCWGFESDVFNGSGQVSNSSTAVPVSGISGAVGISTGTQHACAVLDTGAVECWGSGANGDLGNGSGTDSIPPVAVSGLSDATAITSGYAFSCALRDDGEVACWGENFNGQLGSNGTTDQSTPALVTG